MNVFIAYSLIRPALMFAYKTIYTSQLLYYVKERLRKINVNAWETYSTQSSIEKSTHHLLYYCIFLRISIVNIININLML